MFALVDCNAFFCSVERAFHPGLRHRPVCVLSSNDGCIVALTPEAKTLGLRRGDPLFRVRDVVERGAVTVFSGNMPLYAAMSRRVTGILRRSFPCVENYSIDESFIDLAGLERRYDLAALLRETAERIRLWTDIPVSVGIAPTKTLAKMGSKFAKQYAAYRSVCLIDTEERRRRALELFPLDDVWGVGRRTLSRLRAYGVQSPAELAVKSEAWVRSRFALPLVRTWRELRGEPCIDTSEVLRRQSIGTSRTFGAMVTDRASLAEAVSTFAASCACKLRAQASLAAAVTVFVSSNPHRDDLMQYGAMLATRLPLPTADTLELTSAALALLDRLYRPGIHYKRAGVLLGDITGDAHFQTDCFDPVPGRACRAALMRTFDRINQRYGPRTIRLATEFGSQGDWLVRSAHRSPDYLSDIHSLLTVKA